MIALDQLQRSEKHAAGVDGLKCCWKENHFLNAVPDNVTIFDIFVLICMYVLNNRQCIKVTCT